MKIYPGSSNLLSNQKVTQRVAPRQKSPVNTQHVQARKTAVKTTAVRSENSDLVCVSRTSNFSLTHLNFFPLFISLLKGASLLCLTPVMLMTGVLKSISFYSSGVLTRIIETCRAIYSKNNISNKQKRISYTQDEKHRSPRFLGEIEENKISGGACGSGSKPSNNNLVLNRDIHTSSFSQCEKVSSRKEETMPVSTFNESKVLLSKRTVTKLRISSNVLSSINHLKNTINIKNRISGNFSRSNSRSKTNLTIPRIDSNLLPARMVAKGNLPALRFPKVPVSSFLSFCHVFITAVMQYTVGISSAVVKFTQVALVFSKRAILSFVIFLSTIVLAPCIFLFKGIFSLAASWMKLYGEHGIPELQVRKFRMCFLMGSFAVFAVAICIRLCSLQGIEHMKWEQIASKQHKIKHEVSGARGLITDRNGVELAVSIPSLAVGIHPDWVKNKEKVASQLAPILSVSQKEILNDLTSKKSYSILARGVSQSKEKEIRALKIHGLEVEKDFLRLYPQGNMASTIVGRTGRDGFGLSGIERSLESVLKASSMERAVKRDARGRLIDAGIWEERGIGLTPVASQRTNAGSNLLEGMRSMINPRKEFASEEVRNEGGNITLTIDSAIQSILEEEIDRAKDLSKAAQVFGVVMDAHTGEVLAMGQTHRYNPNESKSVTPEALRNVILQNSYEPGSTFKPIVAAIALDQGYTKYHELINCENGKFKVGKHTIKDVHPVGTVSFEQIIVRSSNIGMVKMGFRMGKEKLHDSLRDFGFGDRTKVGLDGESAGIFRNSSRWATVDIATHSFGQGISVTALQMMQAYGAIANGGMLVPPKIIKDLEGAPLAKRVLKEETSQKIRKALHLVTEDAHGTGKNSRIPGIPVYGKTGTAQKARNSGKGYDPSKVLASFIGFVDGDPIGVPRTLVAYIAVDEPGVTPRWGGTLAAPVFRNVLERSLSYLLSQDPGSRPQMARTVEKEKGPLS